MEAPVSNARLEELEEHYLKVRNLYPPQSGQWRYHDGRHDAVRALRLELFPEGQPERDDPPQLFKS